MIEQYQKHVGERAAQGIPPLPTESGADRAAVHIIGVAAGRPRGVAAGAV